MATADKPTASIVPQLARHEAALQEKLENAAREAREIVERARVEARQFEQQQENALADDVARIRHDRQAARHERFQQTVSDAEARLAGVREEANRRIDVVANEVMTLFMPRTGGDAV